MKNLIVASKNKGKLKEIEEIVREFGFEVISMSDRGYNDDIEETGSTFEENALLKAKEIFSKTKEPVIADDSGLEVEFLGNAPGVYSARYAGENATDKEKNLKILSQLKDVPFEKRKARFVCVIAAILNENDFFLVKGVCEGYIGTEEIGENGFGYDPIFYMPEFNMTTAQMEPKQKHLISHRGKALKLMIEELKKIYNT